VTGPVLIVVDGLGSATPLEVIRAARNRYTIVFAIDDEADESVTSLPLLQRLGPVIRGDGGKAHADALSAFDPDGIATFSEGRLPFAARLAEQLGLPFHRPETVGLLTDKTRQRSALNAAGVSVTRMESVSEPAGLGGAAARVGYPVIVKPAVGNSSRWATGCQGPADVDRLVDAISGAPEVPARWIVEELLPAGEHSYGDVLADMVSVESVVQDGEISHFAITDRLAVAPPFREHGLLLPTLLRPEEHGPILDLTTAALTALGVRLGVTHTEVKLTPGGPRIVEVNGRLGGWVGELMRRVTTVDPVAVVLDVAAGRPVDVSGIEFRTHAAVVLVQPPEGRHQVVEAADAGVFRALPGVWQAWRRAMPGDVVDSRAGSLQALYAVYAEADRTSMTDTLCRVERIGREAAVLRSLDA